MKNYKILSPPFSLDFAEMSKKELRDYCNWYIEQIPLRMHILIDAVQETEGYEKWTPDYSPKSLEILGDWFETQVETRKKTQEEIDEIYESAPKWFSTVTIDDWDLTNKTFSLAVDVGMYMSQVFLKNNPELQWYFFLKGKNHVNYGKPVIINSGKFNQFEPNRVLFNVAYGYARQENSCEELKKLYEIWNKKFINEK